ncbi:MAG: hypothetical protein N2045_13635 [Fimbriimonadales bacterium]|nr:hypothetical protein [Fimbriimonadales bacterium]
MSINLLPDITFYRIHPTPSGSSVVKSPSRIIDQRHQGLVTFIWNVPVPLNLDFINYRIGLENQERLSTGEFVVWGPTPLVAVSVTFTPRTNFATELPVTVQGCLIDPQGRTYARLESPRTVQLLIANYIADPSLNGQVSLDSNL